MLLLRPEARNQIHDGPPPKMGLVCLVALIFSVVVIAGTKHTMFVVHSYLVLVKG